LEQLLSSGKKDKANPGDMLIERSARNAGGETILTFDGKTTGFPLFGLLK